MPCVFTMIGRYAFISQIRNQWSNKRKKKAKKHILPPVGSTRSLKRLDRNMRVSWDGVLNFIRILFFFPLDEEQSEKMPGPTSIKESSEAIRMEPLGRTSSSRSPGQNGTANTTEIPMNSGTGQASHWMIKWGGGLFIFVKYPIEGGVMTRWLKKALPKKLFRDGESTLPSATDRWQHSKSPWTEPTLVRSSEASVWDQGLLKNRHF